MVKQIVRSAKQNVEHVLGTFITAAEYGKELINEDCDLYGPSIDGVNNEQNIIFKFRKGVFTPEEQRLAYEGLRDAAQASQNRGVAAGPRGDMVANVSGEGGREWVTAYHLEILDFLTRKATAFDDGETVDDIKPDKKVIEETRGHIWLKNKVKADIDEVYEGWFERWLERTKKLSKEEQYKAAYDIKTNYVSTTNYAATVLSGIAGYFDRYPRIPYGRPTAYTENNPEQFAKCYPYLRKLDKVFRELLPERYGAQRKAADTIDKRFTIDGTVFTTLTVNYNWRTACHRDAGDFTPGFSNISAISGKNGWKGGEFLLPEYDVAIKLEPGDCLLVNNHEGIHGNDALTGGDEDDRISIVAYFRESMLNLKSWEYETLRRKFVDDRRTNTSHPEWRPVWNGVGSGMWASKEWAEYLKAHNMIDEDGIVAEKASLEELF